MAEPEVPIIRVDEWEMRKMFNDGGFREKVRSGELRAWVRRDTHPSRTETAEPFCTRPQEVSYLDDRDNEVARVHQYVRPDGTIGASGLPDPKRLLVGGVLYRLQKKKPAGNC